MLGGRVRAGEFQAVECTVCSISTTGAKLMLRQAYELPEVFILEIAKWRQSYKVRLVWHKGRQVGVEFREQLCAPRPTDPKAALLAQLT
jgi:hypothetical protein